MPRYVSRDRSISISLGFSGVATPVASEHNSPPIATLLCRDRQPSTSAGCFEWRLSIQENTAGTRSANHIDKPIDIAHAGGYLRAVALDAVRFEFAARPKYRNASWACNQDSVLVGTPAKSCWICSCWRHPALRRIHRRERDNRRHAADRKRKGIANDIDRVLPQRYRTTRADGETAINIGRMILRNVLLTAQRASSLPIGPASRTACFPDSDRYRKRCLPD